MNIQQTGLVYCQVVSISCAAPGRCTALQTMSSLPAVIVYGISDFYFRMVRDLEDSESLKRTKYLDFFFFVIFLRSIENTGLQNS